MPTNYTGVGSHVSQSTSPVVAIPADGDPDNAATFDPGYQTLADHVAKIWAGSFTGQGSNPALTATAGGGGSPSRGALQLVVQAAPSAPSNGDLWITTAAFFARINGASRTVAVLEAAQTWSGAQTFSAGLSGNVTGNVTGNVIGNLTGNVTGNVSGTAGNGYQYAAFVTPGSSPTLVNEKGPQVGNVSVVHTSTGLYTFTLSGVFAYSIILATIQNVTGTSSAGRVSVACLSGHFTVMTSDDAGGPTDALGVFLTVVSL